MTIVYIDEIGIVREDIHGENIFENSIDFLDGWCFYTSGKIGDDGNYIERKIPISSIVRIVY